MRQGIYILSVGFFAFVQTGRVGVFPMATVALFSPFRIHLEIKPIANALSLVAAERMTTFSTLQEAFHVCGISISGLDLKLCHAFFGI